MARRADQRARDFGNGISLIIYAGIVVGLPGAIHGTYQDWQTGALGILTILVLIGVMVLVVAANVFVERAQRKIPIQYARRVVGRKVYGGQATYLPLRVNTAEVIPVIFASSMLAIPTTVLSWGPLSDQWRQIKTFGHELVHAIHDYAHWLDRMAEVIEQEARETALALREDD